MTEPKPSQRFLIAFAALREATHDDPHKLISFFRDSPPLVELAEKLKSAAGDIDFLEAHLKVFTQVSPEFIANRKLYRDDWRPAVEYVYGWPLLSMNFFDKPDFVPPSYNEYRQGKSWLVVREESDPELDDAFDPERHDGGIAVRDMLSLLTWMENDRVDEYSIYIANTAKVGREALEYLQTYIGIDIARCFDRWQSLPNFFVPAHVSDRHGIASKDSLFGLLNEAVRAYVAGAPGAAVSMCRALLEQLLLEHYLENQTDGRDGLQQHIRHATKMGRFSTTDKDHAMEIKNLADAVLHRKTTLTSDSEAQLVAAFIHLKHWIETAPPGAECDHSKV